MQTIIDRIESYFIQMEWPFERIDDRLWLTQYQGDIQVHRVFVSLDEPWLSFRSLVAPVPPAANKAKVYEHLLRLNSLIPLTKFSIMENGDIFGLTDVPTHDLDFSEFHTAITTMINHLDTYDNEIIALCEDESRASSLVTT